MNLTELIEQFQKLQNQTENTSFRKILGYILSLLTEIEDKNISEQEKLSIQGEIRTYLGSIQTEQQAKIGFKKLRKSLTNEFGFVPSNYYVALGIGIGLAIGTALGISFEVPFDMGIVYGPMIGSGIGLIAGIVIGKILDKKKEDTNRVLKNL